MRKRYRKWLVHNNSKIYSREKKRELLKGEYVTNYEYFRKNHISRLLFGKCLVFEGIEQSGWYPRKTDLIVRTEGNLSRKEIRRLNIMANALGKELFVEFAWGPKGPGSIIMNIILEIITEKMIKKLFNQLLKNKKTVEIKKINTRYENGKQYLTLVDDIDNIYEINIAKDDKELEQKIIKTIKPLGVPYKINLNKENELIYNSSGNEIHHEISGTTIDISI